MRKENTKPSQLCYSSDRQLSFDLVNVGRQRLDFLPMLEHSGTYRETAMHKGTFAQEIITLVHHVKELYFKGDSVTLNERFSAPQKGGYTEEEEEEEDDQGETETLTLDKRFSAHRGFSLNSKPMVDDSGLLFEGFESVQGLNQQPMRGPGDLRHDLERRRQEKLEGVKVTIPGKSLPQRPPGPSSEMEYSDKEEMAQADDEEFSSWPAEQSRRWEGSNTGPRRGAPYRTSTGPQRRNPRQRLGPNRRQNPRMNHAGSYW